MCGICGSHLGEGTAAAKVLQLQPPSLRSKGPSPGAGGALFDDFAVFRNSDAPFPSARTLDGRWDVYGSRTPSGGLDETPPSLKTEEKC